MKGWIYIYIYMGEMKEVRKEKKEEHTAKGHHRQASSRRPCLDRLERSRRSSKHPSAYSHSSNHPSILLGILINN